MAARRILDAHPCLVHVHAGEEHDLARRDVAGAQIEHIGRISRLNSGLSEATSIALDSNAQWDPRSLR